MVMLLLETTSTIVVSGFKRAVVAGAAHGVLFDVIAARAANDAAAELGCADGAPKFRGYPFAR